MRLAALLVALCRTVYFWMFFVFSSQGLYVVYTHFSGMVRSHSAEKWEIFTWMTMAIYCMVLGIAWWMIVRGKRALKRWAIGANLILIFTWLPTIVSGNWRGFLDAERAWWPVILVGIFGIIIFSLPYGHAALTLRSFSRFAARCHIATLGLMLSAIIVAYLMNGKFGLNNHLPVSLRFSLNALNALCAVVFIPFWIGMIWDCLFRSRLSLLAKALWLTLIVTTFYIGMLASYFAVFEERHFGSPSDGALLPQ